VRPVNRAPRPRPARFAPPSDTAVASTESAQISPDDIDQITVGWARPRGWPEASRDIAAAPAYWLSTTRADGTPRTTRHWGVWLGDRFYFEGGLKAIWVQGLVDRPSGVVAVEHHELAALIFGTVSEPRKLRSLFESVAAGFTAKYGERYRYRPRPQQWLGDDLRLFVLKPDSVSIWAGSGSPNAMDIRFDR